MSEGPTIKDLIRVRGDTCVFRIQVTDDGAPVDVAGWSARWTIHSIKDPEDVTTQVGQVTGALVAPTADGIIEFVPAVVDVDYVGNFFYDVETVDAAGRICTVLMGKLKMLQDKSK